MTLAAFPLHLAVQSAAIAALGLLAERLLRSRGAPVRQAVLFGSVLMLLAAPPAIWASSALRLGLWSMKAPPAHTADVPVLALGPAPDPVWASPAPAAWPFPWTILPAILWGAGALVSLLVLFRGLALTRALLGSLRPARDPRLERSALWAAERLALPFRPRVGVSGHVPAPFAAGILRPTVVLPEFMEGTMDEADLREILLHEEAHLLHRHPLFGLLQRLAVALYWWNPLVRLLDERLSGCQEEVCDNHVLEAQGSGRRLASCLLDLAERAAGMPTPAAAFPLFRDEPGFESRVKGLLAGKERRAMTRLTWKEAALSAGLSLAVLVAMLGCTPASAEPEAKEKADAVAEPKTVEIRVLEGALATSDVCVLRKADAPALYLAKKAGAKGEGVEAGNVCIQILKEGECTATETKEVVQRKVLNIRRPDAGEGKRSETATVSIRVEEEGAVKAEPTLTLPYGKPGNVRIDGLSLTLSVSEEHPPQISLKIEKDGKPAGEFSLSVVPGRTSVVDTQDRKLSITLK